MSERPKYLSAADIRLHPAFTTSQWGLHPADCGYAEVANGRLGGPFPLWYEVHGQGPTKLAWIMGLGASRNVWKRQTRHFGHNGGDQYSCLVFDNRGVGKSAKPVCRYTTAEMAKDVLELLKHIGWLDTGAPNYPRDINVIGVSLGGMIAQELALLLPQRIQSLILVATAPRLVRTTPIVNHVVQRVLMFLPSDTDTELHNKARRIFTDKFLDSADTGSLDPTLRFPSNHDRFVAEELAERQDVGDYSRIKGVLLQAIAAGWHCKSAEELARLGDVVGRTRILVMHGTLDETITISHLDLFKAGLGEGPEYYVWDGCGHIPMWEREAHFNAVVGRFVQSTAVMKL